MKNLYQPLLTDNFSNITVLSNATYLFVLCNLVIGVYYENHKMLEGTISVGEQLWEMSDIVADYEESV